jgi:hypothetical protein
MICRMPFGKFRGRPLSEVPTDYLLWLASLDHLRDPLLSAVCSEIRRREEDDVASEAEASVDATMAAKIISTGYKALAQRLHPDHGGDLRAMQALNATAAWIKEIVRTAAQ